MAGEAQRDVAIGLKDTFGKVADDISSKAADFHEITATASVDGAHAFADTDSGLAGDLDGLAGDPEATPPVHPDAPTGTSAGGSTGGESGPIDDSFGSGESGGQGSEGNADTPDCKDPIDPVSGQMMTSAVDVALDAVLPLVLRRAYASGYGHGALFGPGWSSTLDQRLVIDAEGIHFLGDDAQVLNYGIPSQPGQRMLPVAGARWPLTWDRKLDAITILDPATGISRHFAGPPRGGTGPAGLDAREVRRLTRVTDRNGNWLTITRDADGVPTQVDHVGGYRIAVDSSYRGESFRIDGLRLIEDAHPAGVALAGFGYDPAGRLVEVIDTAGIPLVYEYDDADRITAWIDRGGYRYGYRYDADGRIARVGGEDGTLAATFEYDREARRTRVIDGFDAVVEYWYDEHNHLTKVVDPLGNATTLSHDRFGKLLEHTDPLGATTRFVRDAFGNVLEVHRPDGSRARAEYNELHQPTLVAAPGGSISTFEYDERGNLVGSTDPSGASIRYSYDEHGALLTAVDPLGATTAFAVNRAGLPTLITDPLGATRQIIRDAQGNVTSSIDPLGRVTATEFDAEGRRIARTTPDGGRETWEYDTRGNLARHTGEAGYATTFEYGPFRRLLARTDPDGSRYEFAHDRELRLISVTNPADEHWTYAYDAAGRLATEQDFNGRLMSYTHDGAGRLIGRVNGAGQSVSMVRDVLGNLIEQRASGVLAASFEYDVDGALIRAANPDGEIRFSRDAAGRVIAETSGSATLSKTYDALGNRISRMTPAGRLSTWQYDALGRALRLDADGREIAFGYDGAGREAYRWLGDDTAITSEWDQAGRLTTRRVLGVSGSAESRTSHLLLERSWTYRADGSPESITDSVAGARQLALDPMGRVTAVTAESWTESYAYDALGNIAYSADSRAADAATAGPRAISGTLLRRAGRTDYEYDAQHRLVKTVRRTLSGQQKVWEYRYDAYDRMTGATTPDGRTWSYTYDALGRRIAKRHLGPDGTLLEQTRFIWDGTALAEQEYTRTGQAQATVTTWDYEPGTFTPVAQDQRTFFAEAPQHVVDRQFHAIVTDLIGTPTELVGLDGSIDWRRSAGLWGNRLPDGASPTGVDCPIGFPGQYHDAETGLDYNYRRYYDPDTGRYTTPDPLGLAPAPNHHGYVANPLSWLDPLGLAGDDATSGTSPGDFETFYRTMSEAHYKVLTETGRLSATSETFISPTQGFSEDYQGVLVKFKMQPGTRSSLEQIGVRDASAATGAEYPDMPTVGKGWTRNNAFFKGEGADHINIGLGKGKALSTFNDNIAGFDKVKDIGCDS